MLVRLLLCSISATGLLCWSQSFKLPALLLRSACCSCCSAHVVLKSVSRILQLLLLLP